jgi:preprotein translocase subunit SecA
MRHFEKAVMLETLDNHWKEHLAAMDYLRQGIHLRGYAQKNPKQEYKREAFTMFANMLDSIKADVIKILSRVRVQQQQPLDLPHQAPRDIQFQHQEFKGFGAEDAGSNPDSARVAEHQPFVREEPKVGRNDPCPCGSGKKYKQCHGRLS